MQTILSTFSNTDIDLNTKLKLLVFSLLAFVIAVTVHEFAHAYTAKRLGDTTPDYFNRVNLNPLNHLDPIGTFFILFANFGWGKPVQTNPFSYTKVSPKLGMSLVAAAGPLSNILLIIIFSILLRLSMLLDPSIEFVENLDQFLIINIVFNIGIFAFNLIPLPPLDGSKILQGFTLNQKTLNAWEWLERNGPMILIGIILLSNFSPIFYSPILIFVDIFSLPIQYLVSLIIGQDFTYFFK